MNEENTKLHLPPENNDKGISRKINGIIKQILVSGLILVVLFLLMNAPAYYKIISNKYSDITGTTTESPLTDLIDISDQTQTQIIVAPSGAKDFQQKQVPPLDLEIMPTTDRIVIPRINQNVPIVRVSSENLIQRDWKALENDIQEALRGGVVHYPGTSLPGENGNIVITGHSSYFPWDPGRFKDVFALLHDVEVGDRVVMYYNQKKFIYEIKEKFEVKPTQIEVLKQTETETLTLITCTPVGTNLRRLIVIAKPVVESTSQSDSTSIKVPR
ncbi:MAG: class E sortase [Candidatus Gracilibacteria bacterium]|jgi:LPXTG-site transpeptidase (sortase) family protein|nr:class E sortase [Candidatus Gracilibacteria bacterium]